MNFSTLNRKRFILLALGCSRGAVSPKSNRLGFATAFAGIPAPHPSLALHSDATRLYSYQNGKNQDDSTLLSKIGSVMKSVLPTRWFGSEEEKLKLQHRKETRQQVSSSLNGVLKDAPLGFRMIGAMMGPLFDAAASGMAETMAEQKQTSDAIFREAQDYSRSDPAVTSLLGEMIQFGAPSSQATSSTIINGVKQLRVEMVVPISGQKRSGIARILATEDGIAQLQVEAVGRILNVDLSKMRPSISHDSNNDIIEAEIVDKETKFY
eukprot:scaffold6949_cov107-Cylindrotheca_fusiformis.AAC.6